MIQIGRIEFCDEDIIIDDWGIFVIKQMIFIFTAAGAENRLKAKAKHWKVKGNMLELEF